MYSVTTFSMFQNIRSKFVNSSRVYLDKTAAGAQFNEAACMFLKKKKMHLQYPFSWVDEPAVFKGLEHEAKILQLKLKTGIFSAKTCGEASYLYQKGDRGFIERIDVHSEWQKKGIASLLVQTVLAEMDEAQVKTVEGFVCTNNHAIMALAKKFGFSFKNGYSNGLHVEQRKLPVQDFSSKK